MMISVPANSPTLPRTSFAVCPASKGRDRLQLHIRQKSPARSSSANNFQYRFDRYFYITQKPICALHEGDQWQPMATCHWMLGDVSVGSAPAHGTL